MRRVICLLFLLLGLATGAVPLRADTFTLVEGQAITGDILSADDRGVVFRLPDDRTSDRVSWGKFTQESLRAMQKNTKTARYIEPYLDIDVSAKAKKREVTIVSWEKPPREKASSFLLAFFGTGLGMFIAFLIYVANLYAAYEVAVVRAYPWWVVVCVSAVVPILGPAIFLCLPTRVKSREEEDAAMLQAAEEAASAVIPLGHQESSAEGEGGPVEEAPPPAFPPAQRFARGQFTFNRRFFETKFPSWFTVVRREADKEMQILFKTARGTHVASRISRITANDLAIQVTEGAVSKEVTVPFLEIQEVILKHQDDPTR